MKENTDTIYELLKILPSIYQFHSPTTELYSFLSEIAKVEIKKTFSHTDDTQTKFGQFGEIIFPYRSMGAINSLDLFGLDELIIFSFYWKNKNKYQNVVDIGANIGLHSIIMCRTGYNVRSYEPDPIHYKLFNKNLELNQCSKVETNKSAVSSKDGEAEFIRVLGNTTGSHIAGAKKDPYGDLEKFKVKIDNFIPIIEWADLIKIDAEGHEADILLSTKGEHWENCDAIV